MPPVNPLTPASSTNISQESRDSSKPEDQDIWFDAIDHVEMEETWFEGAEAFAPHEEHHTDPSSSAGEAADSRVPFTEDCRRGVKQLVRTLGEYGESRMLSACLSKILPGTPASLVIAANSLYTAVTERRNIDTAALHALGLASGYLPENINVVSRLAAFIRDTVTGWTDETFLQQFLGNEENHTSIHLFTALAVTVIVAGRWMKDEGAPQRGVLKVPAFMANIFIRASHYWTALGNMAGTLPSGAEIPDNTGTSQHAPAFEVNTRVEMTGDVCDVTVPCSSSAPQLTAFSSNSTANPEAYTRATVQNRPAPEPGGNTHLSLPEQAHYLAVEKLRQESGLSDLLNCVTRKSETRQQTNEKIITSTHFSTKCDATAYPEPLRKAAENIPVHTDTSETQVSSSATGRSGGDALLPLVMTGAAVAAPVATSYMQALKSKPVIAAGAAAGLTGLTVAGKALWSRFSSSESTRIQEKKPQSAYAYSLPDKVPFSVGLSCNLEGQGFKPCPQKRHLENAMRIEFYVPGIEKPVDDNQPVIAVANDYSCIEERRELNRAAILRTIAESLRNPFGKFSREWKVFYKAYLKEEGCPSEEDLHHYEDIFNWMNFFIRNIINLFPQFLPVRIAQNFIAPFLELIADYSDGRGGDLDAIEDMNSELMNSFQIMIQSLDLPTTKEMFHENGKGEIRDIMEFKKNGMYLKMEGGNEKFNLKLDSRGAYISTMKKGTFNYERQYVKYSWELKKWEVKNKLPEMDMNSFPSGSSGENNINDALLMRTRLAIRKKNISSRQFASEVLVKSGVISKNRFNDAMLAELEGKPPASYLDNVEDLTSDSQLKNLKAGHVLLFRSKLKKNGYEPINHIMVSLGDGLFSGAENNIICREIEYSSMVTSEQLGRMSENAPGSFITRDNRVFYLQSGAIKGSKTSLFDSYKNAASSLKREHYKLDNNGISAIAEVLSGTGDVSSTFSSYLQNQLKQKNPILPVLLNRGEKLTAGSLDRDLPVGGIMLLTKNDDINFREGIFSLRLSDEELLIPSLYEPNLRNANAGATFKINEIKNYIIDNDYTLRKVSFSQEKVRVPLLLGKDSAFFAKGDVLHVRAHGFPGLVNYWHANELSNIIKGLSISKGIYLNSIKQIELQSCYGALNLPLIPSMGQAVATLMKKKVIAYRGKYRTGAATYDLNPVTFTESPINSLQNFVMEFAAEQSLATVQKIRRMFTYLENTEKYPANVRSKRGTEAFYSYLINVGRLILNKISIESFYNTYEDLYGLTKANMNFITQHILTSVPENSVQFADVFLEILALDEGAMEKLFSQKEDDVKIDSESIDFSQEHPTTDTNLLSDEGFVNSKRDELVKTIESSLGLSGAQKFLAPRNQSMHGEPGDIYYDNNKNRYFILRKEGTPKIHSWNYPGDGMDNDEWFYAGAHPGTLARPKGWFEYGCAGSIYYGRKEGYVLLKEDGRPSDLRWYYPTNGQSNDKFDFIARKVGDFRTPYLFNEYGYAGSVYAFRGSYFILKFSGVPEEKHWFYPNDKKDNEYWIYAGDHEGCMNAPKKWDEYGKPGSIYYDKYSGYFMLKVEGRPSDNNWHFPAFGKSDEIWSFISSEIGTFSSPKLYVTEGLAGEIYIDVKNKRYFILRRDGKPSTNNWSYPDAAQDNDYWQYVDINAPESIYNDPV